MTDTTINITAIDNINDLFPYPGEDNDTQTFRDNFNTIKVGLKAAHTDLHDLYTNTARTDAAVTDFGNNTVKNAVLLAAQEAVYDFKSVQTTDVTIDYNNGLYQIVKVGNDIGISFTNLPNDTPAAKVGKIRLELTSSVASGSTEDKGPLVTFRSTNGVSIKYGTGFPTANDSSTTPHLRVFSTNEPVILEIWQYSSTIYIRYLGTFSEMPV
jgi:hypothetical protein